MSYLLHQLVDRAAASAPDREALCFEGDSLSYAEYAQRTDRCAAALHELGIRRGDRVGIFASKGIDAAVAQYGIWKAGAASVPFDPWLPPERLALMLRDCEIRVFFTDRSRLRRLQAAPLQGTGLEHLVGIEADDSLPVPALGWGEIERLPTRPPDICLTEQDLAYIFYTSGSTGEPKGMMHTHRSGLSFVDFTVEIFDLLPEDRFGNHAPLHFDLSIFDYVSAASVAATTVIVSRCPPPGRRCWREARSRRGTSRACDSSFMEANLFPRISFAWRWSMRRRRASAKSTE
jgi:non-ribosomal peptide synthetase component F